MTYEKKYDKLDYDLWEEVNIKTFGLETIGIFVNCLQWSLHFPFHKKPIVLIITHSSGGWQLIITCDPRCREWNKRVLEKDTAIKPSFPGKCCDCLQLGIVYSSSWARRVVFRWITADDTLFHTRVGSQGTCTRFVQEKLNWKTDSTGTLKRRHLLMGPPLIEGN